MLVLEYKAVVSKAQAIAIEEAICTSQFVRNKVQQKAPITDAKIGIDVGLEHFYSDNNGNHEPNPRFLRKAEEAIKPSQRNIDKKKKGLSGRRKARGIYARKHLRVITTKE